MSTPLAAKDKGLPAGVREKPTKYLITKFMQ